MPAAMLLAAFQFAELSIVTSSTSELLNVFRIPHMYWSTSRPSSWAGLLQKYYSHYTVNNLSYIYKNPVIFKLLIISYYSNTNNVQNINKPY